MFVDGWCNDLNMRCTSDRTTCTLDINKLHRTYGALVKSVVISCSSTCQPGFYWFWRGYFNLKVKTVIFQILAIPYVNQVDCGEWMYCGKSIPTGSPLIDYPPACLCALSSCGNETVRLKCFSSANWLSSVMVTSPVKGHAKQVVIILPLHEVGIHRDMGVFTITTFTRALRAWARMERV